MITRRHIVPPPNKPLKLRAARFSGAEGVGRCATLMARPAAAAEKDPAKLAAPTVDPDSLPNFRVDSDRAIASQE